MLGNAKAMATVAVHDLKAAERFYGGVLGLKEAHREGQEAIGYQCGGSELLVYRSEFAGTNKATSMTFEVEDVTREVATLRDRGVRFEHYDFPDMQAQDDVYVQGDSKVAWFKDPEGNILCMHS